MTFTVLKRTQGRCHVCAKEEVECFVGTDNRDHQIWGNIKSFSSQGIVINILLVASNKKPIQNKENLLGIYCLTLINKI
jgi:hypothetical protein